MEKTPVITIDGPSASGKTSVSREVAKGLGWSWVSTGAFYRGLAYVAQQTQKNLSDEQEMADLVVSPLWEVQMSAESTKVFYGDKDVTAKIFSETIGAIASQISQYPMVREKLLDSQRNCVKGVSGLVAEGRDCGTVVFPHALLKVYLTARDSDRALRRAQEEGKTVEETLEAQKKRDTKDTERKTAPLQVPEHAHVVDTSKMNLEQVVEHVLGLAQQVM